MRPDGSRGSADRTRPWLLVSAAFVRTGGQDRANLALASYLARQSCPLHIVAHRVAGDLGMARGVVVHSAPRPIGSDMLGEPFLQWLGRHWASRLGDARVVVNGGNCAWPDVNWVHYVHAAYNTNGHGGMLRKAKGHLAHRRWLADEKKALLRARLVIANSDRTAHDLMERVGVPCDRIRVVYYGIDPGEFHPAGPAERAEMRAALGWPIDRPVALFIGALGDRRKGFDTLFAAWRMLARKDRARPLLAVIGRGAQLAEWRQRAATEGLGDTITFLGFRQDVPRLVRAADLPIAPTRYEAYGLGVHEALCCGLPAIVSADAGVAERYPYELGDLLLPSATDVGALAARIEWCLGKPSGLTAMMSAFSARLRTRTWDDMAAEIAAEVAAH